MISNKKRVLLVNPKLTFPINVYSDTYSEYEGTGSFDQKSMNVGLLAIASYILHKGHEVEILDLQDVVNDYVVLLAKMNSFEPDAIGISCNSCYAYLKTGNYAKQIKLWNKDSFIFAGGQHIGALARIAATEITDLDCIIKYEGEYPVEQIMSRNGKNLSDIPGILYRENGRIIETENIRSRLPMDQLPPLEWQLYPEYRRLVPNVEISRGCSAVCSFCTNYHAYGFHYRSKSAKKIVEDIDRTLEQYGNPHQMIYFGGMNFDSKDNNMVELIHLLSKRHIRWRTESRVDCLSVQDVKRMSSVGLEVIDWGLDSVDPTILSIMKKTSDPKAYLEKCEALLDAASELDVINKMNLMFYPGETADSISNTLAFVTKNRNKIDVLSPKPTMLYPGTVLDKQYQMFSERYGTRKIVSNFWNAVHAYPLHLSHTLSYDQAKTLSLILEKIANKFDTYYLNRLSSLGYNDLSKDEFLNLLCIEGGIHNLRFNIPYERLLHIKGINVL